MRKLIVALTTDRPPSFWARPRCGTGVDDRLHLGFAAFKESGHYSLFSLTPGTPGVDSHAQMVMRIREI